MYAGRNMKAGKWMKPATATKTMNLTGFFSIIAEKARRMNPIAKDCFNALNPNE